jgi:methylenetetrahydrofolate dehydrogenase (NADP+)/methenyltetrahydrofolate cyclohydrolase
MIIDGKQIAAEIYASLKERPELVGARLGMVVCGGNPATQSYVALKEKIAASLGVALVRQELPQDATTQDVVLAVEKLSGQVGGIVVQLPLPEHIDTDLVLASLAQDQDVDALNHEIPYDDEWVHAPVAEAVLEIFERAQVRVAGKKVAVVGMGRLVGIPVSEMLIRENADVNIFIEGDSLEPIKEADIIVSGVGTPGLIAPSMVKPGAVLIDAGTSEQAGKLAGDIDPACAEAASVYTPVPGGVGPITVAMLFKNFAVLLSKNKQ